MPHVSIWLILASLNRLPTPISGVQLDLLPNHAYGVTSSVATFFAILPNFPSWLLMDSPPTAGSASKPRQLGLAPTLFVVAFAFLLASFPARNSEIWLHLATGRRIVETQSLGTPLSGQPEERSTGHSWLFDVAAYGLFSIGGGSALVLAKAALAAVLAALLLNLSHRNAGVWIPVVCTMLALLAISMRLLVYPATLSYFLFGTTLWLLYRHRRRDLRKQELAPPWPLLLVFMLWPNCDSSFVIGLAVVAFDGLGRLFDILGGNSDEVHGNQTAVGCLSRTICWVMLLGCASAINPSHVRAFVEAPELQWLGIGNPADGAAAQWVSSPFHGAVWGTFGTTPAGLAYVPLLGLGLFSFFIIPRRERWRRFLPWLGLALLSAVQVRAVPYFAVLAGPVLAWNLQDFFARQRAPVSAGVPSRWVGLSAKLLGGTLACAFLAAAWPGWLQAPPYEPRRWAVETAPGLEGAAQTVQQWRRQGKLAPDAVGLHVSADTAYAFAWFNPQNPGMLDPALWAGILRAHDAPADWEARLRAAHINHLVVQANDRQRLLTILERLAEDSERWPLLAVAGDVAVFGWRDPAKKSPSDAFAGWELKLDEMAFHPAPNQRAPRVPAERQPDPTWAAFWQPRPPRLLELDEAAWHLSWGEAQRRWAPYRRVTLLDTTMSAGIVGALANWNSHASLIELDFRWTLMAPAAPEAGQGPDSLPARARFAFDVNQRMAFNRDDTPPGSLLLAIRGARRALARDPNNAQAQWVLGDSYARMLRETRERARGQQFPQLARLRRVQASAALNQAIALRPDFAPAHLQLGSLYLDLGFADLALSHLRIYRDLNQRSRRVAELNSAEVRDEQSHYDRVLKQLASQVETAAVNFAADATHMRVLDRAQLALNKGLALTARDILENSDLSFFGPDGMVMQQEIQLLTGRSQLVRDWTSVEHKNLIGATTFHWLQTQARAALGHYAAAREQCNLLAVANHAEDAAGTRAALALEVGKGVLADRPVQMSLPAALWRGAERLSLGKFAHERARSLRDEANANVLLGLLALEEGSSDEADVAFRLALSIWQGAEVAETGSGLDFAGRRTAQDGLEWLK